MMGRRHSLCGDRYYSLRACGFRGVVCLDRNCSLFGGSLSPHMTRIRREKARGQLPAFIRAALLIPRFIFISKEAWSCKTALGEDIHHTEAVGLLTFENVACDAFRKGQACGSRFSLGEAGMGRPLEPAEGRQSWEPGPFGLRNRGGGGCLSRAGVVSHVLPPSVPSTWVQALGVSPAFAPHKTCHMHPWQVSSAGSESTGLEASEFVKLQ